MLNKYFISDIFLTLFIIIIGAAEAANLVSIVLKKPLSQCDGVLWLVLLVGLVLLGTGVVLVKKYRREETARTSCEAKEYVFLGMFLAVLLSQILFLILGGRVYLRGDMTMETVQSFLATDQVYSVNPLTGGEYTAGVPFRIKILCLPTLYTFLCGSLRIAPGLLVWRVVPVIVLLMCYLALFNVSEVLFPKRRDRQLLFMLFASVVMWVGSYAFVMDGFGLLFAGWRGVTIRNCILVPYTLSLCLRGKQVHALLCVVAEACILWTLYGLGVCSLVLVGITVAQIISFCVKKREAAE